MRDVVLRVVHERLHGPKSITTGLPSGSISTLLEQVAVNDTYAVRVERSGDPERERAPPLRCTSHLAA